MAKMISANKLNRLWKNGVMAKMVAKTKVLKTMQEVSANTNAENVAGATAVKELNNKLVSDVKVNSSGQLVITKGGADSVLPFKRGLTYVFGSGTFKNGRKTINTEDRPKLIVVFGTVSNITGYSNNPITGVYITDDEYNILVHQGAYTLKEVTADYFVINNTQSESKPYCYIYGY